MKVIYAENVVDFDVLVEYMDDEIREDVHNRLSPCTEQEFTDEYEKLHRAKYGDDIYWI